MIIMLLAFPFVIGGQWLSVAYNITYFILAALGVQLLIGYCGQITLGHAAFVAVGAYCSAVLMIHVPWPDFMSKAGLVYPVTIVCAGFAAGFWSVLFGLPSARVKGFYLIMTTMAAQFVTINLVLTQYVSQIGGRGQALNLPMDISLFGISVYESSFIGGIEINTDTKLYYFSVILMAICLLAMGNLLRSKIGRAWVAIRDNDIAAETMGVNIIWYKLLAFFVAGFFAGIAGSFWIITTMVVSPEHFIWYYSLLWVGIILIGGVGSIQGLVFGSAFIVLVFKFLEMGNIFLTTFLMKSYPEYAWMTAKISFFKESAFGLAVIFFLIYEPNGLAYRYWQMKNYFNLWPFSYTGKGH